MYVGDTRQNMSSIIIEIGRKIYVGLYHHINCDGYTTDGMTLPSKRLQREEF